jgi:hypothetical protein
MKVALYIKTKKQYDPSLDLVIEKFEDRVLADGGTFEAFNCLKTEVDSLGGVSGIALNTITDFAARVLADGGVYESENCLLNIINDLGGVVPAVAETDFVRRIELFEDEKISLTSSIQNVNDISKVFTDYSQSFTIPASDNNNEIFRHWYENSLDNGFDQRVRYDGYIELDTQLFRTGKWQLESASLKNNRIEDYKITFYGDLKSLTDKFGEDKLNDVEEINDYTISYSGTAVRSKVTVFTPEDVMFPLITSDRVWQYGVGGANDISTSGGAINYDELYPAIKVARVFDAIADKYNLNFSGTFLNQQKFNKAYLWLKGNDSRRFVSTTQRKQILFNNNNTYLPQVFNIENNTYNLVIAASVGIGGGVIAQQFNFRIVINFPAITDHRIFIYKDGSLFTTLEFNASQSTINIPAAFGGGAYTFFVESFTPTTYTYSYSFSYTRWNINTNNTTFPTVNLGSSSGSLNSNLNLLNYMPDIKVTDFFSGILKMFNLTAFSTDGINFTLEQLENWYFLGDIKDFSEYCTTDLDFNRIKPYKKINFEYEKSENVLSRNFFTTNSREYGNLSSTFNTDGSDYSIKLPFENLLFNKFTGTNLQVGYALKSDLTPYAPKPIILYFTERKSGTLFINNGSGATNISNFNVFGQDCIDTSDLTNNTLNWGVEISSYFLEPINNSLFNNYYLAYLNNLYSLKSRMVKVKMRLPYLELLNLRLNDRIVIRDKRYIINQYTTDLTTFESDFELIQDFRSINYDNSSLRSISNQAVIFDVFTTSKEPLTWTIAEDVDSMITGISFNELGVKIEVKPNVSGLERNASIISNNNDLIAIIQDA